MEEQNKKIGFWPTYDKNIKWTSKRLLPAAVILVFVLFDRFFGNTIARNPQLFNIVIGVAWILMLLNTVWLFKQGNQSYSTAMRVAFVFMLVFLLFYTLGHYLHFF